MFGNRYKNKKEPLNGEEKESSKENKKESHKEEKVISSSRGKA